MSLHKYDRPLRIELSDSLIYRRLIQLSHLLTALLALCLSGLQWWTACLLWPLYLSYQQSVQNYQRNSGDEILRLHADGRCIAYPGDGAEQASSQIEQVVFLPYLLIIRLRGQGKRVYRLLFMDAMCREDWQKLQLFLRLALQIRREV